MSTAEIRGGVSNSVDGKDQLCVRWDGGHGGVVDEVRVFLGFLTRWQLQRNFPSSCTWVEFMIAPYSLRSKRLFRLSDKDDLAAWYIGHSVRQCSSLSTMVPSKKGRFSKYWTWSLLQQNLQALVQMPDSLVYLPLSIKRSWLLERNLASCVRDWLFCRLRYCSSPNSCLILQ